MVKRIRVEALDDLDNSVDAFTEVTIILDAKTGLHRAAMLDLGEDNYKRLTGFLEEFFEKGRKPGTSSIEQQTTGYLREGERAFNKGFVRYAESVGKPLRERPQGGYYYAESGELKDEFARLVNAGEYNIDGTRAGK